MVRNGYALRYDGKNKLCCSDKSLTGRDFLKFFLDINGDSVRKTKSMDEYFDYMSIEPEDRDKLMKDYSDGMKNKMQMLVNIIAEQKILLLDEPLTSLDVVVVEEMKQLFRPPMEISQQQLS